MKKSEFKTDVKNEVKSMIVRTGLTMEEVCVRLKEKYGRSSSASNLSNKLARGSLRYTEAVELADVLEYEIVWIKRR